MEISLTTRDTFEVGSWLEPREN